jgi:hypothetical protein
MRSKFALPCVAVLVLIAANAAPGSAQYAGFQTGIGSAQFGPPPAQPTRGPAVAVRSAFVGNPIVIVPAPVIPQIPLVPNFNTVIVPNQMLMPGITLPNNPLQPGVPLAPQVYQRVPQVQVYQPAPQFYPPVPQQVHPRGAQQPPLVGMPRAEVLQRFGQPSVTIITSTGETLYFSGGATVIIQNGQVIGTK